MAKKHSRVPAVRSSVGASSFPVDSPLYDIKRVLFVCTGNTCRSPMAAALFRHMAEQANLPVEVVSAGVHATKGAKASSGAVCALAERGLSLNNHKAARVQDMKIKPGDLVLGMTRSHADAVRMANPASAHQVYVLREFLGENGDVSDPFGGTNADYDVCAAELENLMQRLVQKLKEYQNVVGKDVPTK